MNRRTIGAAVRTLPAASVSTLTVIRSFDSRQTLLPIIPSPQGSLSTEFIDEIHRPAATIISQVETQIFACHRVHHAKHLALVHVLVATSTENLKVRFTLSVEVFVVEVVYLQSNQQTANLTTPTSIRNSPLSSSLPPLASEINVVVVDNFTVLMRPLSLATIPPFFLLSFASNRVGVSNRLF